MSGFYDGKTACFDTKIGKCQIALFCSFQLWSISVSICVTDTYEVLKHFHMNSVVRQLLEQDTDVVMVDTGDSYEGICAYFKGTYITYSKEHPISMNPFKITKIEYEKNFGEKKNFLKSLIFLIYKGNDAPTKIEDKVINQTIVEYFEEYFHPFSKFTEEERKKLRERLLLEDKKNGEFGRYEEKQEEKYSEDYRIEELEGRTEEHSEEEITFTEEEKEHHANVRRKVEKLHSLANDSAATDGEKIAANHQLMRLMPELIEKKYLMRIERKIDRIEKQRKEIKVKELSFNTYYEFALERRGEHKVCLSFFFSETRFLLSTEVDFLIMGKVVVCLPIYINAVTSFGYGELTFNN